MRLHKCEQCGHRIDRCNCKWEGDNIIRPRDVVELLIVAAVFAALAWGLTVGVMR